LGLKIIYPEKTTAVEVNTTNITGGVTFINGNPNVTATGGAFTTELEVGDRIKLYGGDLILSEIASIIDDDNLILTANHAGTGGVGVASVYEENKEFVDDNILDDHLKQTWRSATTNPTMTLTVGGSSNAIAIFNTNANKIKITIKDTEGVILDGPYDYNLRQCTTYYELITDGGRKWTQIWAEYAYQSDIHKIELEFIGSSDPYIKVGVIKAGLANIFRNPKYGLSMSLEDKSIIRELSNGADYIRHRDVIRKFKGSLTIDAGGDIHNFLHKIHQDRGIRPMAYLIVDENNFMWATFARAINLPDATRSSLGHYNVTFNLKEAI